MCNGTSGNPGIPGSTLGIEPGMTVITLTKTARGLIAAPMINAATIVIARRRRTLAVWADICV
jgi:hypothetical protein